MKTSSNFLEGLTLKPECITPFFSLAQFSSHELIQHALQFSGPADVSISSFSISEAAVRSLLSLKKEGMIKSLLLLFDISIPKRKMDIMLFAHGVFTDIRLINNHSKVVIINGVNKVCIVSSQNLTPNPRIEAGVVFTTQEHFLFYSNQFNTLFNESIPFAPF